MDKKLRKAKWSVALSMLFLLLSILGYFSLSGSLGWFAANKQVQGNGMQIAFSDENNKIDIAQIKYYPIDHIELDTTVSDATKRNVYHFSTTAIADEGERVLGTLSAIVAERQLLLELPVKEGVTSLSVAAKSDAQDYLLNTLGAGVIPMTGNSISSIIQFQTVSVLTTQDNRFVLHSKDLPTGTTFVDATQKDGAGKYSFTQQVGLPQADFTKTGNKLYILLDYYELSAELVRDTASMNHLNAGGDISETPIQFICDFTFVIS